MHNYYPIRVPTQSVSGFFLYELGIGATKIVARKK